MSVSYRLGELELDCAGDCTLMHKGMVAVVGSRRCSDMGLARARKVSTELAKSGLVVASGLAAGVDTVAHWSAIMAGGSTVGFSPMPLWKAYPRENEGLLSLMKEQHLVVTRNQKDSGEKTVFLERNSLMAMFIQACVIVEAQVKSGTLHMARATLAEGRRLFIMRSNLERGGSWVEPLLEKGAVLLDSTEQIIQTFS